MSAIGTYPLVPGVGLGDFPQHLSRNMTQRPAEGLFITDAYVGAPRPLTLLTDVTPRAVFIDSQMAYL